MTTSEVRKIISESPSADWFNSIDLIISYPKINFSRSFKSVSGIHKFLTQQVSGWEKYGSELPRKLQDSKNHFTTLKTQLESFVNSQKNSSIPDLTAHWAAENRRLTYVNSNELYLVYNCPQTEFLISVNKDFPDSFIGAYNYTLGGSLNPTNKNELKGYLLAYEFDSKDHTELTQRRNREKASISKIRNSFGDQLTESETQLNEHLSEANKNYNEHVKKIDELKTQKEKLFDDWFSKSQNEFTKWDEKSNMKIAELESTYREKLKLEAPARYWQSKSTKYYKDGKKSKNVLLWLVTLLGIFLSLILVFSPEWIFIKVFEGNATAIIRWSIIFIVLISFIAFAVRTIAKVMFSSFHLARDAEERHTLTFFYLALLKDTEVSEDDRKLILQSLFSRVDTGLLKEDSGPTMPNDLTKYLNRQ